MKIIAKVTFLLFSLVIFSCSGDQASSEETAGPAENIPVMQAPASNNGAATAGIQHYVCPNSCAGSGAAMEGTCPTCGSAYVHNAAYHSQSNTSSGPTATSGRNNYGNKSPLFKDAPQTPVLNQSSASNTAGVYHYTCPNGCAGGAAASGACASCGAALAHNQAYHQNTSTQSIQAPNSSSAQPAQAQNAAGEYHYTCPSGCAGGAAAAGTCSSCGATLAHNQAFHQ